MTPDPQQPKTSQRREWLSILKGVFNILPIPIGRVSWGSTIPQNENCELQSKPPKPKHFAGDGLRQDRCSEPMDKIRADALLENLRNADAKRSISLKRPLGRHHTEYHNTCKSTKMDWCINDSALQRPAKLTKKHLTLGDDADSSTRINCRFGHHNWPDKKPSFNRSMPTSIGGTRRHVTAATGRVLDNTSTRNTDHTRSSQQSILNMSTPRDISSEKFTFRQPPSLFDTYTEDGSEARAHENIPGICGQNQLRPSVVVANSKNLQRRNDNAILAALASLPRNSKRMSHGASSLLDMDDPSPNNSGPEAIRSIIREEMDRLHSKIKNGFDGDLNEQAMGPRWTCVSCFSLIDPSLMVCPICKCSRNPSRRPDAPSTLQTGNLIQESTVGKPLATPNVKVVTPSIVSTNNQITSVQTITSLPSKGDESLRGLGEFESRLKRPASKLDSEEPKVATTSRSSALTPSSLKFSFVPVKTTAASDQVSVNHTFDDTAKTTAQMFTLQLPGVESSPLVSGAQPPLPLKISFEKSDAPSSLSSISSSAPKQFVFTTPVVPISSVAASKASVKLPLFSKFETATSIRDISIAPVCIANDKATTLTSLPDKDFSITAKSFLNFDNNSIQSSNKEVGEIQRNSFNFFDKSQGALSTPAFPPKFSFSPITTSTLSGPPISSIAPPASTIANSISFANFKFGTATPSSDAKSTMTSEVGKSLFNSMGTAFSTTTCSSIDSKIASSLAAPSFGLSFSPSVAATSTPSNLTPSSLFGSQLSLGVTSSKPETSNAISFAPKLSFGFTPSLNTATPSTGASQFPLFGKSTSATSESSMQPAVFSSVSMSTGETLTSTAPTKSIFQFGLAKNDVQPTENQTSVKPKIFQFGQSATNGTTPALQPTSESASKLFVFGASAPSSQAGSFLSSFGIPSTKSDSLTFGNAGEGPTTQKSASNSTSNLFGNATFGSSAPKVTAMPSLFRFSGNTSSAGDQSAVNGQLTSSAFPVFGQSMSEPAAVSTADTTALPSFPFGTGSGLEPADTDSGNQNPFSVISEIAGRKTKHPRKQLQSRK